jgi:hypothetical protein
VLLAVEAWAEPLAPAAGIANVATATAAIANSARRPLAWIDRVFGFIFCVLSRLDSNALFRQAESHCLQPIDG